MAGETIVAVAARMPNCRVRELQVDLSGWIEFVSQGMAKDVVPIAKVCNVSVMQPPVGRLVRSHVGSYSGMSSRRSIQFFRGEVAGAPQIPAGDRAPGLPFFCATMHFVRFGEIGWGHLVGGFQFAEGEGKAFADAVVVDGEDVGSAEAEDEEHLDSPLADATNLCQVLDDCFVRHAADARKSGDGAIDGLCGEVAEGEGLVVREARSAELFVGAVEKVLG